MDIENANFQLLIPRTNNNVELLGIINGDHVIFLIYFWNDLLPVLPSFLNFKINLNRLAWLKKKKEEKSL